MKFLHIADLHLGKSMNELPLAEADQPCWIDRFLQKVSETGADAVVIAGDIYDRSAPSDIAVELFDRLVTGLSQMNVKVMAVAGNHDSGMKLSFASHVLDKQDVFIAGVPQARIKRAVMEDEHGRVNFWLVPYMFPQKVSYLLGCDELRDYDSAFRKLLAAQDMDLSERNVIVCHQNVTNKGEFAERGGSESMVAGIGGIEYTAFDDFEYAALGHIHKAQWVGRETVRYAGSPLCYHFNEAKFPQKGAVLVELGAKGDDTKVTFIPIEPLHPVRIVRGKYDQVAEMERKNTAHGEYIKAEITDRRPDSDMHRLLMDIGQLHNSVYLEIVYSPEGKSELPSEVTGGTAEKSMTELFGDFCQFMHNDAPDEKENELIEVLAHAIGGSDFYCRDIEDQLADKLIEAAIGQEGLA